MLFFTCLIGVVLALAVLVYSCVELAIQIKQGYGQFDVISKAVVLASIPV
jgi:hypothetical protein